MDIKQALEILDIDLNSVKLTNLTHEYIRKKYHKLALINHPDKNGDTVKFQQICKSGRTKMTICFLYK